MLSLFGFPNNVLFPFSSSTVVLTAPVLLRCMFNIPCAVVDVATLPGANGCKFSSAYCDFNKEKALIDSPRYF